MGKYNATNNETDGQQKARSKYLKTRVWGYVAI